ncbi:MAG: thioredoxin [Planctomycetes bacterium]|nr:thioredoxin [Planctomycetota bacterium]
MAGANTLAFSDQTFDEEVIGSDTPVVVDFWAEWCGPCKALGPVIDELADDNVGKAKVGKLDIDSNQGTAVRFSVTTIPTVIIFKGGEVAEKFIGIKSKKDLQAAVDKAMG